MKRALFFFTALASSAGFAWTLAAPGVSGWSSPQIEVQYDFSLCSTSEKDLLSALDQAVEVWNGVEGSSLRMSRARAAILTSPEEFSNRQTSPTPVVFCDPSFQSRQSLNAHSIPAATRTGSKAGHLVYSGVVLNAETGSRANVGELRSDKLALVLAHELGHALGLGHSGDPSALMYFSLDSRSGLELSQDDQEGVRFLYARNELLGGPFGCASAAPQGRTGFAWLGLFLFCATAVGRGWHSRPSTRP